MSRQLAMAAGDTMVQRIVDRIEAPGGKVVVIQGDNHGAIDLGVRTAPIFIGLPPGLQRPLVGRAVDMEALRLKLCAPKDGARVALHGLPGAGKTALATAAVYDEVVREHFQGAVLWAGLGPRPDVESALARWAAALGMELGPEGDSTARARRFSALLQGAVQRRPVLVVLDDVWRADHATPFLAIAFPGCSHLLTSRDASIARNFAGEATAVRELGPAEAQAFLLEICPQAGESAGTGLRELVEAVGGLPLGLTLVGAALQAHAGQLQWVRSEIARLKDAKARLALETLEQRAGLEGATQTLRAVVELSVDGLESDLREAFAQLGVFAPKPSDFAEEVVFTVWDTKPDVAAPWLRTLLDRGLMEVAGEGRFTLHQVLSAVAEARLLDDAGPRYRHARAHLARVDRDWNAWRDIEQDLDQVQRAWAWSSTPGREEELTSNGRPIVLGLVYGLMGYFDRRGLWRERVAWITRGLEAAQSLGRREDQAALLNNLGLAQSDLGDMASARRHFEESLKIHSEIASREGEATAVLNLGLLCAAAGEQTTAREYYERALTLFRDLGDRASEARTLLNVGDSYRMVGKSEEAGDHLERALEIQREVGDRIAEAFTLDALGAIALRARKALEARAFHEGALQIHQEEGNRAAEAMTLASLGMTYSVSGEIARAMELYKLALPIQREIGDRKDEAVTLNSLANAHAKSGERTEAWENYERALSIRTELGDRVGQSVTLYNIALLCEDEGDCARAIEYLERALEIEKAVGYSLHNDAAAVLARLRSPRSLPPPSKDRTKGILLGIGLVVLIAVIVTWYALTR